jgi:L-ribulose-5-phosphate 3-epimerase
MSLRLNRRDFLAGSAAAGAGVLLASRLDAAPWKTTLHKGIIADPDEKVFKELSAAGFEGIETVKWQVSPHDAAAARKMGDSLGIKIHSVCFGWGNLNGGADAMAKTISEMQTSLLAAQAYGAGTVLLVPCRTDVTPMPEPWEFDIRFDEKTGHVKQVVSGDNTKYAKYIEAQNQATDVSKEGVRKMIPAAEKAGVVIMIENVWNNLWVQADLFKNFVASFQSPWVKVSFDIANHVKYSPPQDWIHTLGKMIAKCHAKEFKLNPNGHGGDFCKLHEGSVDWPAVRKALDDIGYNGWLTIEDGRLPTEELGKRLELIIAGK